MILLVLFTAIADIQQPLKTVMVESAQEQQLDLDENIFPDKKICTLSNREI